MEAKLLNDLVRGKPHLSLKVPISYTNALRETIGKPMIIRHLQRMIDMLKILLCPLSNTVCSAKLGHSLAPVDMA